MQIERVQEKRNGRTSLRRKTLELATRIVRKELMFRAMSHLPETFNARLKADHYVRRASNDVCALERRRLVANTAMYWPEIPVKYLSGIKPTRELIETRAYPIYDDKPRWPADIEASAPPKVLAVSSMKQRAK